MCLIYVFLLTKNIYFHLKYSWLSCYGFSLFGWWIVLRCVTTEQEPELSTKSEMNSANLFHLIKIESLHAWEWLVLNLFRRWFLPIVEYIIKFKELSFPFASVFIFLCFFLFHYLVYPAGWFVRIRSCFHTHQVTDVNAVDKQHELWHWKCSSFLLSLQFF